MQYFWQCSRDYTIVGAPLKLLANVYGKFALIPSCTYVPGSIIIMHKCTRCLILVRLEHAVKSGMNTLITNNWRWLIWGNKKETHFTKDLLFELGTPQSFILQVYLKRRNKSNFLLLFFFRQPLKNWKEFILPGKTLF